MKVREIRIADPERIHKWVEENEGRPAQVIEGKHQGELRIDFPGEKNDAKIEHISWNHFFEKFDERNLIFTRTKQLKAPKREA